MLEQLSAGATSAETAGRRCQQTLRDVQRLLDPAALTQYLFRVSKPPSKKPAEAGAAPKNGYRKPALSSFAKVVFENTEMDFRYLTPESPEPKAKGVRPEYDGEEIRVTPRQIDGDEIRVTPRQMGGTEIRAAPRQTSGSEIRPAPQQSDGDEVRATPRQIHAAPPKQNGSLTPHPTAAPQRPQGEVSGYVVVDKLTPAQLAEHRVMPDGDNITVSQPTPIRRPENNLASRNLSVDQKQKGDNAVQTLDAFLHELFEAEDQLEPDTSGAVAARATALFATRGTEDGSAAVLQPESQVKLDTYVLRVVQNGRLESIEVEDLIRAQRICESAVNAAVFADLKIGDDWNEGDTQEWMWRLADANKALVAGRTLLRIMAGGSSIKELQSEDFLRAILETFTNIVDNCIVPVVEVKPSQHEKGRGSKDGPPPSSRFVTAYDSRKQLQILLQTLTKSLRVLGDFLTRVEMDETGLSKVIYLCKMLILAENANNDRDSVMGVQNFEITRQCAMDVLAKISTRYSDQRQDILEGILSSLEKLPATKQSARHFRLPDARPIQLVSALLMRLVQTSATFGGDSGKPHSKKAVADSESDEDADSEDEAEDSEAEEIKFSRKSRNQPEDLPSLAKPLHDAAQTDASYIVRMLMRKALTTSKSSDEPYRKLLDIFTEDFLNVLSSSDWPSSQLLLFTFVVHMVSLVENPKNAVPSRTLALELLATIGSGILALQMSARNAVRSLDMTESAVGSHLVDLVHQLETGEIDQKSLVSFDGPYRMVIEYLHARGLNDAQIRSAQGFHLMQWAFHVYGGRESSTDSDASDTPRSNKDLQNKLRNMLIDPQWLEEHHDYPAVSTAEGRLAAMVVTLSSKLCKAFNKIFNVILSSLSSEQSTVRSRGLKSVAVLLDKDPSILDRMPHVLNHIFRCADDPSSMARDSALKLIEECIAKRPALDGQVMQRIIVRTRDGAAGVRKRAIKMLKDIYLRNDLKKERAAIADAIIARMQDNEESVKDIARQTMEEIWFLPFQRIELDGDGAVEGRLRYGAQAGLLIHTVESSDSIAEILESMVREFTTKSKAANAHFRVCHTLVRILFDGIIDSSDIKGKPEQPAILRCLAIFAKANPKLFNAGQLERLEPYTQNLTSSDDLEVYRSAVAILRHVMPHQATLKQDFLQKLQTALLGSTSKVPRTELAEVVPCLWTINGMLGNIERLVTFVTSAVRNLKATNISTEQPALVKKAAKLMTIIGQFGNACDFDKHIDMFKAVVPSYKGNSVAALLVEVLCPYTSPKQPLTIREVALEAVCTMAQAWPKLYLRSDVVNALELVFKDRVPELEFVLLSGLEAFFSAQEVSKGSEDVPALGSGIASGEERLGKTYVATDQDGATTSIAQRFMQPILRLGLSSSDETAIVASKLIVSINRQGMTHPKDSGPALVALETCPNTTIANMAYNEHKAQHIKHETLFDREYMRAIQQAFEYQRHTLGSTTGFTGQPPLSKMHLLWDVLKTGRAQVRKKFLSSIAQKMDFNLGTLDVSEAEPPHLHFVRFCAENLAFFDYDRVEELLHLLGGMEKIFSTTGTAVAQAIENDVLKISVEGRASSDPAQHIASDRMVAAPGPPSLDPKRLHQLAVAAQICSLIWETRLHLRKMFNLQKYTGKPKNAAKENAKAPSRATNAPSLIDAYQRRIKEIMSAHPDPESQRALCTSFVELISVDSEVRVATDEDDTMMDAEHEEETPSEGSSRKSPSVAASGGGRGRKRKSNGSTSNTPRKKGRPSMGGRRKSSSAKLMDGDEDDDDGGWD
jgi:cohesin loading factor subunit SCC2